MRAMRAMLTLRRTKDMKSSRLCPLGTPTVLYSLDSHGFSTVALRGVAVVDIRQSVPAPVTRSVFYPLTSSSTSYALISRRSSGCLWHSF